jgi:hypothetical protein
VTRSSAAFNAGLVVVGLFVRQGEAFSRAQAGG